MNDETPLNAEPGAPRADQAPGPAGPKGWRERLHAALVGRPYPLLVTPERILPAASLWTSARAWVAALRAAGIGAGDRVVLAADAGPAFVPLLVAGLWESLSLVVVSASGTDPLKQLEFFDARLMVGASASQCPDAARHDAVGLPIPPLMPRSARRPRTPDCRLLLQTSGTTRSGRWIALSDSNLFAVLDSHRDAGPEAAACVLSVLPWHHAFGLILDLLAGLLAGAEIFRLERLGGDPDRLLSLVHDQPVRHLNAVPITLERLRQSERGAALLRGLTGGLVGGAPVSAGLADFLSQTRLRVGYGQTEASPGICLGAPGEFSASWLGRPVGCRVRVDADGVLAFSGANAALGEWTDAGLQVMDPARWVRTGDLVRAVDQGFLFEGRLADGFKMTNGRFLSAAVLEQAVMMLHPAIEACMVGTLDGRRLEVAISAEALAGLDQEALGRMLADYGVLQFRLHPVPSAGWVRRPKGDLDRRQPPWR